VPGLDLYGRELLAVDGTRIKAVNNKDRNFTRASLQDFIRGRRNGRRARTKNLAEKIEALRQKRGRYGAMLADLERTGENQISLTDPGSRAMAAHTKVSRGVPQTVAGSRVWKTRRCSTGWPPA
jgi:hypothetical protein